MSNEKIQAMTEALWPHIRAKIQEEFISEFKPRKRIGKNTARVYHPEIDWMVHLYRIRNEVRHARFTTENKIQLLEADRKNKYCLGASGTLDGMYCDNIYIPTSTLRTLDALFDIDIRQDYRISPAHTLYLGGCFDHKGERIKNSSSCYTIQLHTPITPQIIQNTKDYWAYLSHEQKDIRQVSEAVLYEAMDIMATGQVRPDQQVSNWRMLEDNQGNTYTLDEAQAVDPEDIRLLSAKKIVATWMYDEVPE